MFIKEKISSMNLLKNLDLKVMKNGIKYNILMSKKRKVEVLSYITTKGSHIKAMCSLFDFLEEDKFPRIKVWNNPEKQRNFFIELAKELGFHTRSDWYKIKQLDVNSRKGGKTILSYYGGSYVKVMSSLFEWIQPENSQELLGWVKKKDKDFFFFLNYCKNWDIKVLKRLVPNEASGR